MNNSKTAAGRRSARVHPLGLLVSAALLFAGSTLPVVAGGRGGDETARRPAVEKSKTAEKSSPTKPAAAPSGGKSGGAPAAGSNPAPKATEQPATLALAAQPGEVIRDLTLQPNQAQILEFRPITQ